MPRIAPPSVCLTEIMAISAYHVSSSLNRESIRERGLDWRRMGAAPGIAGSREPEAEGCFLALGEYECRLFVHMNNTGGPVDVWRVEDVDPEDLITSRQGYSLYEGVIDPDRITLIQARICSGEEFIPDCT